ncbi:uncharacterized protein AB675_7692 [Cyphellophora attinorum]|uniref:Uncharacterized protein n=1 Tax=Cyphellophora attinorum TaxID=1664694 RepID=A0A0N0NML9_9EURO|nr:uncharacterized protein AB675_7692 [Phialophora attinorum]KPI40359.1 hypothetical protein AB675_7692 [Phialophora attinorum]
MCNLSLTTIASLGLVLGSGICAPLGRHGDTSLGPVVDISNTHLPESNDGLEHGKRGTIGDTIDRLPVYADSTGIGLKYGDNWPRDLGETQARHAKVVVAMGSVRRTDSDSDLTDSDLTDSGTDNSEEDGVAVNKQKDKVVDAISDEHADLMQRSPGRYRRSEILARGLASAIRDNEDEFSTFDTRAKLKQGENELSRRCHGNRGYIG